MKNSFKFGFLALAISLTFAACGSNKSEEGAGDSTAADTAAVVDTTSAAPVDSAAVTTDSAATDSAAVAPAH